MRIFKHLFGKKQSENSDKENEADTYMPKTDLPADELFTINFMNNGGKFIYCESTAEMLDYFDSILKENDWQKNNVLCYNSQLKDTFKDFKLTYDTKEPAFFLTTCESLIADKGSILISSNQIKEQKLNQLPNNFIVFATTSQLKKSISEGLQTIKKHHCKQLPSNITTLKHFESSKENDFMSYGSSTKNLYLLLLEDL